MVCGVKFTDFIMVFLSYKFENIDQKAYSGIRLTALYLVVMFKIEPQKKNNNNKRKIGT